VGHVDRPCQEHHFHYLSTSCNCLYLRGLVGIYRFGNILRMPFVFLNEPRVGPIDRAGTYDYAGIDRASDSDPARRSIFDVGHE